MGLLSKLSSLQINFVSLLKTSFTFLPFFLQCWQLSRKQPSSGAMGCRNARRYPECLSCFDFMSPTVALGLSGTAGVDPSELLNTFLSNTAPAHARLLLNAWFVLGCSHLCAVGMGAPGQWGHRALQSCPLSAEFSRIMTYSVAMEELIQSTVYITWDKHSVIIVTLIAESLPTHNIVFQDKLMHIHFSIALHPCLQNQKICLMFKSLFFFINYADPNVTF